MVLLLAGLSAGETSDVGSGPVVVSEAEKSCGPEEQSAAVRVCSGAQVKEVNASDLVQVLRLEEQMKNASAVVVFYSRKCPFSRQLMPLYHALPEAFPNTAFLKVDALGESGLSMRYGLHAYPTIATFKNGLITDKFSGAYDFQELIAFVQYGTGEKAENVTLTPYRVFSHVDGGSDFYPVLSPVLYFVFGLLLSYWSERRAITIFSGEVRND